jgi:cellulose synthase/poly-beta-1,6-N-acetylglucosamine synthase-like glycosyltransferase
MLIVVAILSALLFAYSAAAVVIVYYSRKYALDALIREEDCDPKVTVVLPTYNEEKIIGGKLDNILGLDYPKEKLEIIVVDCSTDRTPKIVKEYAARHPFIHLIEESKRRGLATALNLGYKAATGDIVIKSDVDSLVLNKNALRRVTALFSNGKVGGVCGVRIGGEDVEGGFRNLQTVQQMAETMIDSTIVAHGSFAAFRKDLIEPIDVESFADDTELFVKIRRRGFRTVLDTDIRTYEPYGKSPNTRLKQMARRAGGIIKVLIENREVFFNPKYGRYGLIIYPLNLLMLALSPWMIPLGGVSLAVLTMAHVGAIAYLGVGAVVLAMGLCYALSRPKLLAGFLDILISSFVGEVRLLLGVREHSWDKSRPESVSIPGEYVH